MIRARAQLNVQYGGRRVPPNEVSRRIWPTAPGNAWPVGTVGGYVLLGKVMKRKNGYHLGAGLLACRFRGEVDADLHSRHNDLVGSEASGKFLFDVCEDVNRRLLDPDDERARYAARAGGHRTDPRCATNQWLDALLQMLELSRPAGPNPQLDPVDHSAATKLIQVKLRLPTFATVEASLLPRKPLNRIVDYAVACGIFRAFEDDRWLADRQMKSPVASASREVASCDIARDQRQLTFFPFDGPPSGARARAPARRKC